jgi:hypothetical protein
MRFAEFKQNDGCCVFINADSVQVICEANRDPERTYVYIIGRDLAVLVEGSMSDVRTKLEHA